MLAELLAVPAALPAAADNGQPPLLADLDETAWDRYDTATCDSLARQIVEQVRQRIVDLAPEFAARRLPTLPNGIDLDDLELETRTRNTLGEEGFEEHVEDLLAVPLGELLKLPGFGARSLVDLLSALEEFDLSVVRYPWASRRFGDILDYELGNLLGNPNLSLIHTDDPRFEPVLGRLRTHFPTQEGLHTARDVAQRLKDRSGQFKRPVELITALQELRIRLDSSVAMTLEDELLDIIPVGSSERNRLILYRRMGWDGAGSRTLQAVAEEFGLTRESVRKICNQQLLVIAQRRPFAPTLTRALTLAARSAPASAEAIEELLAKDRYTNKSFSMESLLSAAEVLGWESNVELRHVESVEFVLLDGQSDLPTTILALAREAVTHWGVANVGDLATKVATETSTVPETHFVIQTLENLEDLLWLDAPGGWFWLPSVRHNRLLTQVRKTMAVARRLEVGELRRGIARHHRMTGFAPPPEVLLELCRQQPDYQVEGTTVCVSADVRWEDVLGPTERLMIGVLHEAGGVLELEKFERRCRALGMKESTFYTYLDYSPLLTKHARGVYGLRGSTRPPGLAPSPPPRRRLHRVLQEHGRDERGRVWLRYELSRSSVVGGIVSIPVGLVEELRGEYTLWDEDGRDMGTLAIERGLAWRLNPFFRKHGALPGDGLELPTGPGCRARNRGPPAE